MNIRQIWTTRGGVAVGTTVILASVLGLAIRGTTFVGNTVGLTSLNTNPSIIVDTESYLTPIGAAGTECSGTGGTTTRDTCLIASPFNSSASSRGLRTGTGVVRYLQLEVVANPTAAKIDCSVVAAANTATGGTALVTNAQATGSIATYTTPFTVGPTQFIKCGTLSTTTASTRLRLRGIMMDSNLVN
jgi:hypothetical protein